MGGFLDKPVVDKVTEVGQGKLGGQLVRYAASSMQGWRLEMEDAHVAQLNVGGKEIGVFCCFDGHAGKLAAIHAAANVTRILCMQDGFDRTEESVANLAEAMAETFMDIDEDLLELPQIKEAADHSGCTALALAITPTHYVIANAGDSRLILVGNDGHVVFGTKDHKPDDAGETQRIVDAGATVFAHRVNGDLAVSRALGDFTYKKVPGKTPEQQPVTAKPDVTVLERSDKHQFVLLACDGVWDVMSNEDVAKFILEKMTAGYGLGRCCELLLDNCLEAGSRDNMTAVLIALPDAPRQIGTLREPLPPATPNGLSSSAPSTPVGRTGGGGGAPPPAAATSPPPSSPFPSTSR